MSWLFTSVLEKAIIEADLDYEKWLETKKSMVTSGITDERSGKEYVVMRKDYLMKWILRKDND